MPAGDWRPFFQDRAPEGNELTAYDRQQCALYFRVLDAHAGGATWQEIAVAIFGINPQEESERAERVVRGHLARAQWMSKRGFRLLTESLSFVG